MAKSVTETKHHNYPKQVVYQASILAAKSLGWQITDERANLIIAQVSLQWNSVGNTITISFLNETTFSVTSNSLPTQLIAGSTNRNHLEHFFKSLDKYIKVVISDNNQPKEEKASLSLSHDAVVCPKCGKKYTDGSQYCSTDGTALFIKCASCGKQLQPDSRFCPQCGARINADGSREKDNLPIMDHTQLIACPECGKNIPGTSAECPNCGYPMQ